MAVTAKFLADFSSFETAVDRATVRLRSFETGAAAVEKQLARAGDSFSGRRVLQEAQIAARAVDELGGASRLTEAEQRRLNATVTEAIAKYRALGQDAPANLVQLEQATRKADTASKTFGVSLKDVNGLLGAFGLSLGAGALVNFGRDLLNTADQIVKVADRTGLATAEVQKLQYIAGQSGNSLDEFTGAITRMQVNLVNGDKGAVKAVEALGLNLEELRQKAPFEQVEAIAGAFGKVSDPAKAAALSVEIFGRAGAAILPTLIADFQRLGDEAPVMSGKTVRALDQAGDSLARFGQTIKVWAAESYNFAGQAFDRLVAFAFDAAAAVARATASVLEMAAKIPGGAKALELLGVSIQGVREQAQFFADAAAAQRFQMTRVEEVVRKTSPALFDYAEAAERAASGTREHGKAANASAKELQNLNLQVSQLVSNINTMPPAIHAAGASLDAMNKELAATHVFIADLPPAITSAGVTIREETTSWIKQLDDLADEFKRMAQIAGDSLSGIIRGIGTMVSAMSMAITSVGSLKKGFQDLSSGSVIQGIAGLASGIGGLVSVASAAYSAVKAIFGLFSGGEEAASVNPARDKFLSQFGPAGTGPGSGFHNLAATLTELTGEGGGGSLFAALKSAETMDAFRSAAQSIVDLMQGAGKSASLNFHTGGGVPGSGEVSARLLGGEGVLSHTGMRALARLNGGGGSDSRELIDAVDAVRAENAAIRRQLARLPIQLRDAMATS